MVTCIFNLGTWEAEGGGLCVADQVVRPIYKVLPCLKSKQWSGKSPTSELSLLQSVYFRLTTTGLNLEVFHPLGVALCVDGGLICIFPGIDTQFPYFPVGEAVFSNGCTCCLCGCSCVACIRPSSPLIYVSGFISIL